MNPIVTTVMETKEKHDLIKRLGFNKILLLICLLGFFIRLLYFLLVAADNQLSGDASSYHLTANIFADGLGFTEPFRYLFVTCSYPFATFSLPFGYFWLLLGYFWLLWATFGLLYGLLLRYFWGGDCYF